MIEPVVANSFQNKSEVAIGSVNLLRYGSQRSLRLGEWRKYTTQVFHRVVLTFWPVRTPLTSSGKRVSPKDCGGSPVYRRGGFVAS